MLWNKNTSKIVGITLGVAALLVLAIFGIRALLPSKGNLKAGIYPRIITLNDSIYFSDSTDFARQYRWTFGDGNQSFSPAGHHKYGQPGNYTVTLTVNNKFTDTFFISVNAAGPGYTLADSIIKIEALPMALQNENLVFRIVGKGGAPYRWDFGDGSNSVTTNSDIIQYTFRDEGEYLVRLYTRGSEYPTTHKIAILPAHNSQIDSAATNLDAIYQGYENDFKQHLQMIANGADFNEHFNYLTKKYLCGNQTAVMKINDNKINDFYHYCVGIHFRKELLIQKVKLIPDDNNIYCIKMAEIKQEMKQ